MNVLTQLQAQFPDRLVLYAPDIARVLGKSEKALGHLIARGQLPFPLKKLGGKHCVSLHHVAEWLESTEDPKPVPFSKPPERTTRRRSSGTRSGIGARLMEMRLEAARVLLAGDVFSAEVAEALSRGTAAGALVVSLRCWRKAGERLVSAQLRMAIDDESDAKAVIAWLEEQAAGCIYARIRACAGRLELYRAQHSGESWRVIIDKL